MDDQINNSVMSKEPEKRPLGKLLEIYITLSIISILGWFLILFLPGWASFILFLLLIVLIQITGVMKLVLMIKFLIHPISSTKEIKSQMGSKSFVKILLTLIIISGIISVVVYFLYRDIY